MRVSQSVSLHKGSHQNSNVAQSEILADSRGGRGEETYRAESYLKETSAPKRCLWREKSASKGGGEGFEKSQQKTDFFLLMASLMVVIGSCQL